MFEGSIPLNPGEPQEAERLRERNRLAKRLSRARRKQLQLAESSASALPLEPQRSSENRNPCQSPMSNTTAVEAIRQSTPPTSMLGSIYDDLELLSHEPSAPGDDWIRFGNSGTLPVFDDMEATELGYATGNSHNMSLTDSLGRSSMVAQRIHSITPHTGQIQPFYSLRGSEDDKASSKLLHIAIRNGTVGIVSSLIKAGTNVNSVDASGSSPLHMAVETRRLEILELLIDHGANINARNSDHMTPLEIAVRAQNEMIVDALLAKGAQIY